MVEQLINSLGIVSCASSSRIVSFYAEITKRHVTQQWNKKDCYAVVRRLSNACRIRKQQTKFQLFSPLSGVRDYIAEIHYYIVIVSHCTHQRKNWGLFNPFSRHIDHGVSPSQNIKYSLISHHDTTTHTITSAENDFHPICIHSYTRTHLNV